MGVSQIILKVPQPRSFQLKFLCDFFLISLIAIILLKAAVKIWLILTYIKAAIENWIFFIFSNSSHLKRRAGHPRQVWFNFVQQFKRNLKGDHPRNIPAKFGIIWFQWFKRRKFKCESLRLMGDADSKWCQKLTWHLARCAKTALIIGLEINL